MIPGAILNTLVNIERRTSTGRDSLNNPTYGKPTSGTGWNVVYRNVPVRLAFSSRGINFAVEGERVTPTGVMYYNPGTVLLPEDRVITSDGIEYTVTDVIPGYTFGTAVDHYEAKVQLP